MPQLVSSYPLLGDRRLAGPGDVRHDDAMELQRLAIDHLVPTSEANRIGPGPYELAQLRKSGRIWRPIRGWYAVWSPEDPIPPWEGETPRDAATNKHRLLAAALLRSFGGRVVASHQSALSMAR